MFGVEATLSVIAGRSALTMRRTELRRATPCPLGTLARRKGPITRVVRSQVLPVNLSARVRSGYGDQALLGCRNDVAVRSAPDGVLTERQASYVAGCD